MLDLNHAKGYSTELYCIAKLTEMGYLCSIPYANLAKYDFIVEIDNEFYTVLCKSAKFEGSALVVEMREIYDVDYIGTYYNNQVYLIPYHGQKTIRLQLQEDPTLVEGFVYEIENVLSKNNE